MTNLEPIQDDRSSIEEIQHRRDTGQALRNREVDYLLGLVAERDRLIQALEQLLRASGFFRNDPDDNIATIGLDQAQSVAREALTKEEKV